MPADCDDCGGKECPAERCIYHSPLAPDAEPVADDCGTDETDIEFLIECVNTAWARAKAIEPRGFDTIRARADLLAECDMYLEELFVRYTVASLDGEALPS